MARPRIAIAGFQHETNSFSGIAAGMAEFEMADSWPPLLSGAEVISGTKGMNLPIAGFVAAARGMDLVPILWAAAEPSGPVTDAAFDTITGRIVAGIGRAGALDGIYLDLHGAMITGSHADGEGEILRRIRALVGPDLPIAISLDMHANVTAEMVARASAITMFRTYPHLDMAETGARACAVLRHMIYGARPAKAFRQVPYLIALHAQFTGAEPARGLYTRVAAASTDGDSWAEFALGFTGGDTPHTGPSLVAYAPDRARAEALADALLADVLAAEARFAQPLPSARDAVRAAMARPPGKPVVIADVQDNPGGGGSSDTTGLLRALVAEGAQGVILGVMHDPDVAAQAHEAGTGAVIATALGGRSGISGDAPFMGRYAVEALSAGEVVYEGEMYGGGVAQIGPCAVLRVLECGAEIRVLVSSVRNQCLDRGYFRHIGLIPEQARIIVVKSTVHFRADFAPIAQQILTAAAPGALGCDLTKIPYRAWRPGLRLGPTGPVMGPIPGNGVATGRYRC